MKTLFTALTGIALLGLSSCCAAATVFLTDPNDPALVDGLNYATVSIDAVGEDIRFTIDPNAGIFELAYLTPVLSNFGLQYFGLNVDGNEIGSDGYYTGAILNLDTIAITDISPDTWNVDYDRNVSEFGMFEFNLIGTGNDRADPLIFLITGVAGDTVDNYTASMVGHIADFGEVCTGTGEDEVCVTSAFFGGGSTDRGLEPPAVPIPAAAWLFLSGLLGITFVGRRSKA